MRLKRVISLLLALCLCLSIAPVHVDAKTVILDPENVDGADYSQVYAEKLDSIFAGEAILFSNSQDRYALGQSMNVKQSYTVAETISGYQCYIYANAVYYYLFGDIPFRGSGIGKFWKNSATVLTNLESASCDSFQNAGVGFGAYLRTTGNADGSYNGGSGHSLIILAYDKDTITYLEGNADGKGLVRITSLTWKEFNEYNVSGRGRRISHVVQCKLAADTEAPEAAIKGFSASLGGNISANFSAILNDAMLNDPTAYIRFQYAGKTVTKPVSEGLKLENGRYEFSCAVNSKQMTESITAQFFNEDGPVGDAISRTLAGYVIDLKNITDDEALRNLLNAMLNYGAAAQIFFNYKTNDLANAALSPEEKVLVACDPTPYRLSRSGSEPGITQSGATLELESETAIYISFILDGSKTIDQYTFTVNGRKVDTIEENGKHYVVIPNIGAHRLDEMFTVKCGGIELTYGALSYVKQVYDYADASQAWRDVVTALYRYNEATDAYRNK